MPPPRSTVVKARALRRAMTAPEVKMWQYLRARPAGLRFRRQHPVGHYVLDFYCPQARLAIEIDGIAHDMGDRPARDAQRDEQLLELGIVTLRFAAAEVMKDFDAVARLIIERSSPLHHAAHGPPPHALHGED